LDPWVLFVVEDAERNVIDQKVIETELMRRFEIKSMRYTLKEISQRAKFDEETHVLTINGFEIGFVYYRAGYQVEQYTDE
jgi:glutathione synthase